MGDFDPWYPPFDEYYVPGDEAESYPVRQGDVLLPPLELGEREHDPWEACQLVHPTCELAKRSQQLLQVIRVFPLDSRSSPSEQAEVVTGLKETDDSPRIAWANTFFLPPFDRLDRPMFSDFREIERVHRSAITQDRRLAALSHDTRVYFIRRKLYWEHRWVISIDDVRGLEAARIRGDSAFVGPRPEWAA